MALRGLKRYQEALAVYDRAIQLDSDDADFYFAKGEALFALNRLQEALEANEQALRLDPSEAEFYHSKESIS